jgi:DNA-binding XRE family transcriptional regulator
MNTGKKIARLRNEAGLTQRKLAELLNKTVQTISSWEVGRAEPRLTIDEAKALCKILNCTLDDLASD